MAHSLLLSTLLHLLLLSFSGQENDKSQVQARAETLVPPQTSYGEGAWRLVSKSGQEGNLEAGVTAVRLLKDGYFTVTYFDLKNKKFIGTYGGTYTLSDGKFIEKYEFNTFDSTLVGTSTTLQRTSTNKGWHLDGLRGGERVKEVWEPTEQVKSDTPLEGAWRITGRAGQGGKINQMQRGPRKTMKILVDNRFQWIAFNTATKQFMGTGGGTYSATNGKYTENIEFFSRDPNRVGASLTFDFEVKDGKWHHTGISSTGNKINEIWEKE